MSDPQYSLTTYPKELWARYTIHQQIEIWRGLSAEEKAVVAAWDEGDVHIPQLRAYIQLAQQRPQSEQAHPAGAAQAVHGQSAYGHQGQHGRGVSVSGGPGASHARSGGLAQGPAQAQVRWAQTQTGSPRPGHELPAGLHTRRCKAIDDYIDRLKSQERNIEADFLQRYGQGYTQWKAADAAIAPAHAALCTSLNTVYVGSHLGGVPPNLAQLRGYTVDNLITTGENTSETLRNLAVSHRSLAQTQAQNASRTGPTGAYELKYPPPEMAPKQAQVSGPGQLRSLATQHDQNATQLERAVSNLKSVRAHAANLLRGTFSPADQRVLSLQLPQIRSAIELARDGRGRSSTDWHSREAAGRIPADLQQCVDAFYVGLYYEQNPQARRQ